MRRTALWTLAILVAASAAWAEQTVDERRSVAPDASISIENVAGSLTIIGTDGTELRITGTMGDDVKELDIRGDDDEVSIEVVIPDDDDWKGRRKLSAKLEIRVPRGASLEVEAVSAPIEIRGVSGEIEAASVSGSVTVAGGESNIEVESVSGSVFVNGGSGTVSAESVSGKVKLEGVSGDVEATTVSGRIEVEAGPVEDVELETVAGGVFFRGQLGAGSLEIESHSGNVEALLPADLEARFDLETFSGRIDSDFGPPGQRAHRYEPGMSSRFSTGSGGAEVSIETFSGNILLKRF